jgi:hypothetical protein
MKVRIAAGLAEIRTEKILNKGIELYIDLLNPANKDFEIVRCSGC